MCLTNNLINILSKIFLLLSIIIPIIYLLFKSKNITIFSFLTAILIFLFIFLIKTSIKFVNVCEKYEIDTPSEEVLNEEIDTPNNEEPDNKKGENYVGTTSKGYTIEKIDGAYYVDNYLIVNKSYPLDKDFIPKDTYVEIKDEICYLCIDKTAYNNWLQMKNDALALGLNIYIASGYRAYSLQERLYKKYSDRDGSSVADTYSARAGHSEHQSALAFDLNSIDSSFAATPEGAWVKDNAHVYGFIIRYPEGKDHITGYKYEPWHLRYVGKDLANTLYNNGNYITLEEYFGIVSKYLF